MDRAGLWLNLEKLLGPSGGARKLFVRAQSRTHFNFFQAF